MKKSIFLLGGILFCVSFIFIFQSCDDDDDPVDQQEVNLNLIADGFTSPVFLTEPPGNTERLFVVDQPGVIYIVQDGERLDQPFMDISDRVIALSNPADERGLLGLAFHPDYQSNGRFFVYYSGDLRAEAPASFDHTSYISEFSVSANPDLADESSERIILAVDQPQANHNAGTLAFGADGYLYISLGDGGGAHDIGTGHVEDWYADNAGGNGQDITENLLGSILRIDVDGQEPYAIPAGNPFVGNDGLDEIFAYGFRNPYRFSFDPENRIIAADAGQFLYEEVDLVEKGGNYGWNVKEGTHCFDAENPETPPSSCPSTDENGNLLIDPVIEFKNSSTFSDGLGNAVIGGYVYTGSMEPSLNNQYIFGVLAQHPDQGDGAIFAAERSGSQWDFEKISIVNMTNGEIGQFVLGFGQDNAGEIYVLVKGMQSNSGAVYRIE